MLDFRLRKGFDYVLFMGIILIVFLGILIIYSATQSLEGNVLWYKQAMWFGIGLLGLMSTVLFDYQLLGKYSRIIYILVIFLLVFVLFGGPLIRSARSWLVLGPFSFQPSEFAKLATIIVVAEYLSTKREGLITISEFVYPTSLVAIPVLLILMQPDLGTTLVFLPVIIVMFYITGAKPIYLVTLTSISILILSFTLFLSWGAIHVFHKTNALYFLYKWISSIKYASISLLCLLGFIVGSYYILKLFRRNISFTVFGLIFVIIAISLTVSLMADGFLKDYQRKRLVVFLDPGIDPLNAGYNITQSKIAIGSGKLFGKGLFHGTQSQLGFLPERQSDFIFSVIGEELGFVGAGIILLLFLIIIYRGISIAFSSRDTFGCLLASGIVTMLAVQVFFNVGISLGIMPVTGLTLPLVSYGGSSLFITMVSVGILLNIQLRRYLL
ncbi:MAG: rod shape-determining protein RodA [Nitrospirota bacterium]